MESSVPSFSIVTVCLNPGRALFRTGESVLEQRDVALEWIVKDGLSADGTQKQTWPEAKVRFVSRADLGIFDAMNQALEYCRGQYVLFLNVGDVFCAPDSLSRLASAIHELNDPEVAYSYCEYVQPGNVIKYPSRITAGLFYRRSVCHQATFIRRDCYVRYGAFKTSFQVIADDELLARLVLKHGVRSVRCPFPVVRIAEWKSSSESKNRERRNQERELIHREYLTSGQRWQGRVLYAATLPALRRRWLALPQASPLYRLYITLSNFVNQRL